jgi:hypothetical protein
MSDTAIKKCRCTNELDYEMSENLDRPLCSHCDKPCMLGKGCSLCKILNDSDIDAAYYGYDS